MLKHYIRMTAFLVAYAMFFVQLVYFWWAPAVAEHGIWICFGVFIGAPIFGWILGYFIGHSFEDYFEAKRSRPQATRKPIHD